MKQFCEFGLEHWGADAKGVNTTRKFLLEWLSFYHRYIPLGLMERDPRRPASVAAAYNGGADPNADRFKMQINWRPPLYLGRDRHETLLSSPLAKDWVKVSELFLGKAGADFSFCPKHKSASYEPAPGERA